jgi:hypothetical protein
MKYLLILVIGCGICLRLSAQCPVADTTVIGKAADTIRADIASMQVLLDSMNYQFFYKLMTRFDSAVKGDYNDTTANNELKTFITDSSRKVYLDSLKALLDSQYFSHLYPKNQTTGRYRDTIRQHCFHFRMHKEIADLRYSISLLEGNAERLVLDSLISTVGIVRFLNSYYYMSTCRSLLLARMNSLEDQLLFLKPYNAYPLDKKVFLRLIREPDSTKFVNRDQDKTSTSTDAIIGQIRHGPRNEFLKALGGGAAGTILAYVVIALVRGHK